MNEKRRLIPPVWEKDSPLREERLAFIKMSIIAVLLLICWMLVILWGISGSFNPVVLSIGVVGLLVTYVWFMRYIFRLQRSINKRKM